MTSDSKTRALEAAAAVARSITQAHFGLVALMETLHRQGAFSSGRRALLLNLREAHMTVPQLASLRPVSRQYVQKLMDGMRVEGLVAPSPNPAHRRSPAYTLTAAGRALCTRMEAVEAPALARLAEAFGEAEMVQVKTALDRARTLMDEIRVDAERGSEEELQPPSA